MKPASTTRANAIRMVLVPAAESLFGREGRIEGNLDVPLSPRGRTLAGRILKKDLAEFGRVTAVYTAGNQSSKETAEILAAADSNRIRILKDLTGVSLGLWEGQLGAEVRQRHLRIFDRWRENPFSITPPSGEGMTEALDRARGAARTILRKHRRGTVVVVAPATVVGLLYCHLTGASANRVFEVCPTLRPFTVLTARDGGGEPRAGADE